MKIFHSRHILYHKTPLQGQPQLQTLSLMVTCLLGTLGHLVCCTPVWCITRHGQGFCMHTHTGGPCCPDTAWDLPQCTSSPWQLDRHLCCPFPLHDPALAIGACLGSANRQGWTGEAETTGKWRPLMKTVPRSSLSLTSCSCSPPPQTTPLNPASR